ncbi:Methyltransferase type 11 [Methanosalsum zhilinae DSM 4017]|uniref:Methyltransferase type 11 n=1 Tax=Methanosalsum zhilinae (strain DSM 4017 / NBRC 107636 / OCM 62 / WeN5) TaxID=679901 RepID=F7XM71_METZD|nr:class I SAM-dependent methyltransferase [Methanosalsum zhilinae]AEH60960.1 Methyltransferase type 11 [Methanosalsum zhilinae DSM 4017]
MNVKKHIEEYWDWRSTSYANGATNLGDEERELWKQSLSPYIGNEPLRVLDVGTGRGFLALLLAEMGHDVTAVDISQAMINEATKESKSRNLNIRFFKNDAEDLPFDNDSFDLVVSKYLLWTLPNPDKALEEWNRVLITNGKILAIDGNWFDPSFTKKVKRNLNRLIQKVMFKDPTSGVIRQGKFKKHYSAFNDSLPLYSNVRPESVQPFFEKAGFSNISINPLSEIRDYNLKQLNPIIRPLQTDVAFLVSAISSSEEK